MVNIIPVPKRGCVEQCSAPRRDLLSVNWPEASDPSRTEGSYSHNPDSCQLNLHETECLLFVHDVFSRVYIQLQRECESLTVSLVGGS